jgi:hypothetical protein
MGKPESWGVCESALKPLGVWEGSWRIGQGSKPDLRNSAVRDYRGASGNVARVELCTHLAYRKGEDGNPPPVHRRARALSQQPTSERWEFVGELALLCRGTSVFGSSGWQMDSDVRAAPRCVMSVTKMSRKSRKTPANMKQIARNDGESSLRESVATC